MAIAVDPVEVAMTTVIGKIISAVELDVLDWSEEMVTSTVVDTLTDLVSEFFFIVVVVACTITGLYVGVGVGVGKVVVYVVEAVLTILV